MQEVNSQRKDLKAKLSDLGLSQKIALSKFLDKKSGKIEKDCKETCQRYQKERTRKEKKETYNEVKQVRYTTKESIMKTFKELAIRETLDRDANKPYESIRQSFLD